MNACKKKKKKVKKPRGDKNVYERALEREEVSGRGERGSERGRERGREGEGERGREE